MLRRRKSPVLRVSVSVSVRVWVKTWARDRVKDRVRVGVRLRVKQTAGSDVTHDLTVVWRLFDGYWSDI